MTVALDVRGDVKQSGAYRGEGLVDSVQVEGGAFERRFAVVGQMCGRVPHEQRRPGSERRRQTLHKTQKHQLRLKRTLTEQHSDSTVLAHLVTPRLQF